MFLKGGFFSMIVIMAFFSVAFAAGEITPEARVAGVEKEIAAMNGTLKRLSKEVARARDDNDIHLLNCLIVKLNLVKGLLKASEQAKIVLIETAYGRDVKTANAYGAKISTYGQSVAEIEQSIDECSGKEKVGEEGVTLVYIRPEGEGDMTQNEQNSPLTVSDEAADFDYPVVPPASPYR